MSKASRWGRGPLPETKYSLSNRWQYDNLLLLLSLFRLSKKSINTVTAAGLLITLGIIYGDIGTSPLYVFKAIVGSNPISEELVLGGISCIFWTLTIQTTFKYVILTLRADNKGEGGIFSLYEIGRAHV